MVPLVVRVRNFSVHERARWDLSPPMTRSPSRLPGLLPRHHLAITPPNRRSRPWKERMARRSSQREKSGQRVSVT